MRQVPDGLGRRFLAVRPLPGVDPAMLDVALVTLIGAARARYGITATGAVLVDHIAANAELPDADFAAAIRELDDELVLAAACLVGDRAALDVLDRDYAPPLRALVSSIAGDRAPDVLQDVWTRLLVATAERPARLADYGGGGSLLTWLRVVCAREAISALRRSRTAVVDDEVLLGRLLASQDPSLELIRAQSASEVKRAFEEAVAGLEVRERNLLRQHLIDGLTIDDLAALYRVHRATAARWLASAREAVWTATQRRLRERLRLTLTELESLLGAVRDWLDLSLERVL